MLTWSAVGRALSGAITARLTKFSCAGLPMLRSRPLLQGKGSQTSHPGARPTGPPGALCTGRHPPHVQSKQGNSRPQDAPHTTVNSDPISRSHTRCGRWYRGPGRR